MPTSSLGETYKASLAKTRQRLEEKYLSEPLPAKLQSSLDELLAPGEATELCLRGAFKEVLICTDRRVIILKTGLMTGQLFGTNVFQLPYGQIAAVQVEFQFATGYFQLSAAGVENLPRSYWSKEKKFTPREACNCIAITGDVRGKLFRDACTTIMNKIALTTSFSPTVTVAPSPYNAITELGKLLEQGLITQDEFDTKKREILARI